MIHASCLITGVIRIYYWYKNAELLPDASDFNVNKWRTSILAHSPKCTLAGLLRVRKQDMKLATDL